MCVCVCVCVAHQTRTVWSYPAVTTRCEDAVNRTAVTIAACAEPESGSPKTRERPTRKNNT